MIQRPINQVNAILLNEFTEKKRKKNSFDKIALFKPDPFIKRASKVLTLILKYPYDW